MCCLVIYCVCVCVFLTGKVSIRKEDLSKFSGKEHWFSLHPVDPNSEVQVVTQRLCVCLLASDWLKDLLACVSERL